MNGHKTPQITKRPRPGTNADRAAYDWAMQHTSPESAPQPPARPVARATRPIWGKTLGWAVFLIACFAIGWWLGMMAETP